VYAAVLQRLRARAKLNFIQSGVSVLLILLANSQEGLTTA
jgi:hypothetical protein